MEIEHKRWIYETLMEKVPPFSWVPKGYNVALQLLIMEVVGLTLASVFSLSTRSMFYGSVSILVIWIWSLQAYYIGSVVHKLRLPSAPSEREVINEYRKYLFGSRHREVGFAILILAFFLLYLFLERSLLIHWLDGNLSPTLLLFVAVLLWDVSYRLGLGLWSAVGAFRRSLRLSRISKTKNETRFTVCEQLETLERLDLVNLSFGTVSLLFYPLTCTNPAFFAVLMAYSAVIAVFSAMSFIITRKIQRSILQTRQT